MATEREYLVSKGLAKPSRGRFSREAVAELARVKAEGMVFDAPAVPTPKPASDKPVDLTRKSPVATLDKPQSSPVPSRTDYDPKAVRKWAEDKGLVESGKRGRLPSDVLHKYVSEHGAKSVSPVKRKPAPPQVRTRPENHAWAFQAGDPSRGHSDIRIQFGDCSGCHKRIGFCACKPGPVGPKWLGSPTLSLTKP